MADSLYVPDGDALVPTALTIGPWSREAQHAGPPSALLVRAIEAAAGIEAGQLTRMTVEILRPVPLSPLTVAGQVLRPGRNVELLEATLASDGAPLMLARAWRMRRASVELPGDLVLPDPSPPPPDGLPVGNKPVFFAEGEAYHEALEWRFWHGTFNAPGPAGCWTRARAPLVAGSPITPLEHLFVMVDAASGISAALDWSKYAFMNTDLTVHLERPPAGDWLAMDAVTRPRPTGAGVATGVLYDADGRFGVSAQTLLVAPR